MLTAASKRRCSSDVHTNRCFCAPLPPASTSTILTAWLLAAAAAAAAACCAAVTVTVTPLAEPGPLPGPCCVSELVGLVLPSGLVSPARSGNSSAPQDTPRSIGKAWRKVGAPATPAEPGNVQLLYSDCASDAALP